MLKKSLRFCFKGNRKYIHGTDIYNKLLELLEEYNIKKEKFDISFHGIAKNNINLSNKYPMDEDKLKFACKYLDSDGIKQTLYGIENFETVDCRYEYPEEKICKLTELDTKKEEVCLKKDTTFSFVENVVATNKHLLENIFPEVNGKWYFTRLQLKEIPETIYPLKLVLKANFNFKLTKTEITIGNKVVGNIYFSLV